MADKSFWENLGRGVGYGLRKAKEIGSHLENEAEGRLDLRQAREKLEREYARLGSLVYDRLGAGDSLDPADDELRAVVAEVRACVEAIEKLDAPRSDEATESDTDA